jgi:hypothetical protein
VIAQRSGTASTAAVKLAVFPEVGIGEIRPELHSRQLAPFSDNEIAARDSIGRRVFSNPLLPQVRRIDRDSHKFLVESRIPGSEELKGSPPPGAVADVRLAVRSQH